MVSYNLLFSLILEQTLYNITDDIYLSYVSNRNLLFKFSKVEVLFFIFILVLFYFVLYN